MVFKWLKARAFINKNIIQGFLKTCKSSSFQKLLLTTREKTNSLSSILLVPFPLRLTHLIKSKPRWVPVLSTSSQPSETKDLVSNVKVIIIFATETLPYSVRVLLESAVRNCDEFNVLSSDVEKILAWEKNSQVDTDIPFKPARVILQDFT